MVKLLDQNGKTFEVSQNELYEIVCSIETIMERWPQSVSPDIENGLYKYLSDTYIKSKSL